MSRPRASNDHDTPLKCEEPVYDLGLRFSEEYYSLRGIQTASAVTPIGDLFRHGGLYVMAFGMACFGLLLRVPDGIYEDGRSLGGIFLSISLVPVVAKWEFDIVTFLLGLLLTILAPAVAARLGALKVATLRVADQSIRDSNASSRS